MSSEQWESSREWQGAGSSSQSTATPYDSIGQYQGVFAAEQSDLGWHEEQPDPSGHAIQHDYGNAPGIQGSANVIQNPPHEWAVPVLPTRTNSGSTSWPPALTPSGSSSLHRPSDATEAGNEVDFGSAQGGAAWLGDSPLLGTEIPAYHGLPVPFPPDDSSVTDLLRFLGSDEKIMGSQAIGNTASDNLQTNFPDAAPYTSDTLLLGSDFPSSLDGTGSSGSHVWRDPTSSASMYQDNISSAQQEGDTYSRLPASHTTSFPQPWLSQSGLSALSHDMPALASGAPQTPFDRTDSASAELNQKRTSYWAEEADHPSEEGQPQSQRPLTEAIAPSTSQGPISSCSECQKHDVTCDIKQRTAARRKQENTEQEQAKGPLKCSFCEQQNSECTARTKPIAAKKHGRPSRTGRRIEQARWVSTAVDQSEKGASNFARSHLSFL